MIVKLIDKLYQKFTKKSMLSHKIFTQSWKKYIKTNRLLHFTKKYNFEAWFAIKAEGYE